MTFPRPNPVIHLELHTGDLPGAVAFYGQLLGWRPERIRAGNGSYLTLGVGDRVGGGIVECEAEHPLWVPYVAVPDLERTTDRARQMGSEVLIDPREGPHGLRSVISAHDGGELALWQPKDPSLRG
jgi:predicted enzyme related to lactoylglutathione lyase